MAITHFTHEGISAGVVYCERPRNATDKYIHINLAYISKHRAEICPDCLAVYESCGICENDSCDNCPINIRLDKILKSD